MIMPKEPYRMEFDIGTIKHLGLQMYSTLPPVIGELVANAWDANATKVKINIPEGSINEEISEITADGKRFSSRVPSPLRATPTSQKTKIIIFTKRGVHFTPELG